MSPRNLNFGKNIANMRSKQKISQEELAKKAAISRSMLSKIERDEVSPTIAIANKIARGLHTSVSALLDETQPERIQLRKFADRIVQEDPVSRIERQLLMHTADIGFGIQHLVFPASSTTGILPAHNPGSKKYLLVEQGILRVVLDKAEIYDLQTGDCLGFAADVEHEFQNNQVSVCCVFITQIEPPESAKPTPL